MPIHDKAKAGNFLSQKEVLVSFHENTSISILSDLFCMTSKKTGVKNTGIEKEFKEVKKKRDTDAGKNVIK